jgi:hypothetical protein
MLQKDQLADLAIRLTDTNQEIANLIATAANLKSQHPIDQQERRILILNRIDTLQKEAKTIECAMQKPAQNAPEY